jgi:hypothetical protein
MRDNEVYILIAVVLVLVLTSISFIYAKQLSIFFKTIMGNSVKDQVKERCPKILNIESLTDDQMYSILLNKCPQDCVFTEGEWSPCSATTCGTSGSQTREPVITKKADDLGIPCPQYEKRACFNTMCNESVAGKCFATFGVTIDFKNDTQVMINEDMFNYVKSEKVITVSRKAFDWNGTTLRHLNDPNVNVLVPCTQTSSGTSLVGKCFLLDGDEIRFTEDRIVTPNVVVSVKYKLSGTDVNIEIAQLTYDGTNIKYFNEIIEPCNVFSRNVYKSGGTTLQFVNGNTVRVNSVVKRYTFNRNLYQIDIDTDGGGFMSLFLQSSGNLVSQDNTKIFTVERV